MRKYANIQKIPRLWSLLYHFSIPLCGSVVGNSNDTWSSKPNFTQFNLSTTQNICFETAERRNINACFTMAHMLDIMLKFWVDKGESLRGNPLKGNSWVNWSLSGLRNSRQENEMKKVYSCNLLKYNSCKYVHSTSP